MIRGYVSSDEDDYDEYDFGYSDPLVINKEKPPPLPEIKNRQFKEKLNSALEESKLIKLFLDAIDDGDLAALEDLILLGKCPDERFTEAIVRGVSETLLLGVDVDSSAPQEWTPLMKACVMGKFEVVQFLLERGSNPNKQKELFTPLMACCTHTLVAEDLKLSCVRLLLENGAEVNAKDKHRTTALMYAAGSGYTDIVTELLRVPGIDLNVQDREGWTALFYAVNNNSISIVEKLLSRGGTNLKLKDKFERTVLDLAMDRDFKELAKILGYVEENCPEPKSKEKELSCRFLDELPDSNGQGGFSSDAQSILAVFNQFKVKNISLPDLLNATEEDLYGIGVKFQADRLRILSKGIHRFHLEPWEKSSMHQLDGEPLSLEKAIAITGSAVKHLTVANAALKYLDTRISSRKNKELLNMSVHKDMIIVLADAYTVAEKLKVLLPKILRHAQQIKPEISPDYIHPIAKESSRQKVKLFCWTVGTAAAAALLIHYCRTNPYLKVVISACLFTKTA